MSDYVKPETEDEKRDARRARRSEEKEAMEMSERAQASEEEYVASNEALGGAMGKAAEGVAGTNGSREGAGGVNSVESRPISAAVGPDTGAFSVGLEETESIESAMGGALGGAAAVKTERGGTAEVASLERRIAELNAELAAARAATPVMSKGSAGVGGSAGSAAATYARVSDMVTDVGVGTGVGPGRGMQPVVEGSPRERRAMFLRMEAALREPRLDENAISRLAADVDSYTSYQKKMPLVTRMIRSAGAGMALDTPVEQAGAMVAMMVDLMLGDEHAAGAAGAPAMVDYLMTAAGEDAVAVLGESGVRSLVAFEVVLRCSWKQ